MNTELVKDLLTNILCLCGVVWVSTCLLFVVGLAYYQWKE